MAKKKTEKQKVEYKKITLRIRSDWLEQIEEKKDDSAGRKESRNSFILRAIKKEIDKKEK